MRNLTNMNYKQIILLIPVHKPMKINFSQHMNVPFLPLSATNSPYVPSKYYKRYVLFLRYHDQILNNAYIQHHTHTLSSLILRQTHTCCFMNSF